MCRLFSHPPVRRLERLCLISVPSVWPYHVHNSIFCFSIFVSAVLQGEQSNMANVKKDISVGTNGVSWRQWWTTQITVWTSSPYEHIYCACLCTHGIYSHYLWMGFRLYSHIDMLRHNQMYHCSWVLPILDWGANPNKSSARTVSRSEADFYWIKLKSKLWNTCQTSVTFSWPSHKDLSC